WVNGHLARLPAKWAAALSWCRVSVALMRVLDGPQPTLTQVPPRVPWPISATLAPCSAAVMAAENPADPAPITARSYEPLPLPAQQSCTSGPHGWLIHAAVLLRRCLWRP